MSSFKTPLGSFNPNVGLENKPLRFDNSGATLNAANERLAKYGYSPIQKSDMLNTGNCISAEVGDDEQALEESKAMAGYLPVMHGKLGMKVSEEDTSINPRYGNFAEDLICLPDGYGQTYHHNRNTSSVNAMSYIDICKLRLAIDIRPMRMDHSGTNDGKASMIGSRQRWIPLESPFRGQYELFSLYQDVNLGLKRDKKFAYMPVSLGGYGKEPPFRNYRNFERFLKGFRSGAHSELVRETVHRTIDFLEAKENNENPPKDPLLSHIVRFQSSFHDWVKGNSIYAPITWLDVPPDVAKHKAVRLGDDPVLDDVAVRLLAEGKLISESQLEIAVEHNELCKALLKAETIPEFKRVRDQARFRWQNLSVFSLENYGMIEEITLNQTRGLLRPLKAIEVARFFKLVNEKRYNLRHLLRREFAYWPEAMDAIYKSGPMKVNFEMLPRVGVVSRGFAASSADYRSDYWDTEEIGALDELSEWLRNPERDKLPVPRRVINDDNAIIRECANKPYNIIITDDKKLCSMAAKLTRTVIFRVPCVWYYKHVYFGTKSWTEYIQELTPGLDWASHEDTGSIQSFEENFFKDGVMLSRPSTQKFNILKTLSEKDKFVSEEFLDFSDEPPQEVKTLFYDKANVLRLQPRRKPTYRRSDQGSWRG